MEKLTVSVSERQKYELKARQFLDDLDSRSAAVRHIIDEYANLLSDYEELESEYENLHTRYESREDRIEELESQLRKRSNIEDKIEELPDKIRGSKSYMERRQKKLDSASLSERLKWKLTGVPVDDDN